MRFDDILKHVGGFGPFQWRVYLPLCLRGFCSGMVTLSFVFIAGQSDHWCSTPNPDIVNCTKWSLDEKECIEAKKSVAIPVTNDGEYESCVQYNLTGFEPEDWYPGWETVNITNATTSCDAGWAHDTSQFTATIVTDVSCLIEYLFKTL